MTSWQPEIKSAVNNSHVRHIGHHALSGNNPLFQIHHKLKRVVLRLQSATFVTIPSMVTVLTEQQHCSTTRARALLRTPQNVLYVLGQTMAGIQMCIAINKTILKNALYYAQLAPSSKRFWKMHSKHIAKLCKGKKTYKLLVLKSESKL